MVDGVVDGPVESRELFELKVTGAGHDIGAHVRLVHLRHDLGERLARALSSPRARGHKLGERACIEQLVDGAIVIVHAHDVVADGGGDARYKGRARQLALATDVRQGLVARVVDDLDDGLGVKAVDRTLGATTNDVEPVDGHAPEGL